MSRPAAIICFLSVFLAAGHVLVDLAAAQPEADARHYITDMLVINIRDRPEKPNTVVGVVRTGDAVQILEERDNNVKIQTADNKQGWIAKHYLKKQAPESVNSQQLQQEIADLKKQLETRQADEPPPGTDKGKENGEVCAALQQKLNDAEKQLQQLQDQQRKQAAGSVPPANVPGGEQEQNPELAAQLEETSHRYNQLIVEYEKRGQEIAELQNSIAKQDDTTRFLWFGAGAAVFFLGILAGRSAKRKKNKLLY